MPLLFFVALCVFFLSLLIQLLYWLYFFGHLAKVMERESPKAVDDASWPDLTLVICFRNEAECLEKNLPLWLAQSYPAEWELLLVDDHSDDDSYSICRKAALQNQDRLRCLSLKELKSDGGGKKAALQRGVEAARYPFLLFTDADCSPASAYWIKGMAYFFVKGNNLVLGYSPFEVGRGLLNAFQRFEGLWTAMQYLAFAFRQMPYMGVGRNLAYTKCLYQSVGGFASHRDLPYGDDDLFVQAALAKAKVGVCLNPETFMWTKTKPEWRAYLRAKQRHLSTAQRYHWQHQWLLAVLSISTVLFFFAGLLLLFNGFLHVFFALLFRYAVVWPIAWRLSRQLAQPDLAWRWPFLELLFVLYLLLLAPVAAGFYKAKQWN